MTIAPVLLLIRAAYGAGLRSFAANLAASAADTIADERATNPTAYTGCTDLTVALIAADRYLRIVNKTPTVSIG